MRTFISSFAIAAMLLAPSTFAQEDKAKPATAPAAKKAVSAAEAKNAEELYQDGRKLFFQGKYLDAVAKLRSAADANPDKTSYMLLLAKAHRYGKQPEKAAQVFEELLKANPEHVEAGIELAELVGPEKDPDRVIAVLQPLLKYKHDYPLYHLLAESYYQKEDFDKARKHYEEAITLNRRNASDHYQLANIYLAQKRFAKAATAYETAGQLGLSSGVYHFKLASVYFNLHNYLGRTSTAKVIGGETGGIKDDQYLLQPVPGQEDTFFTCPRQSAIYHAAKAQQMGVDIFEIYFLEANIWLNARRYANASAIYSKLEEKVTKEDAGLFWFNWAQAALGLQQFDAYLTRLDKAIEADPLIYKPTRADALVTVARRYQQQGDTAKHIEYLNKAVEVNPLSAALHLTLGDAYWLSNQQQQAIEQYKLVLELESTHSQRVRLLNRIRGQEETVTAG